MRCAKKDSSTIAMINMTSCHHSIRYLFSHWNILVRVTWNELTVRYAGSLFGIGWAFLTPLIVLAIYSVVYTIIFRIQVPGLTTTQYVLLIFAGLVPFIMTGEAISFGVSSVLANKAVLSNTVFPVDLLPPKAVLMSQVTMVVGMSIILLALLYTNMMSCTVLFLPLIWVMHIMALLGITWLISLINLVFRDLQNLVSPVLMILMVISPIAYTPEMVPPGLTLLVFLNPIAYYIIAYQKVLVLGLIPGAVEWVALVSISSSLFFFGGWFFIRAKRTLIDYV